MRVLVTGGTGQIGGAVARALVDRGDDVRCLVRDPARLGNLEGVAVEVVQGDITNPGSLAAAMDGVDAVVHSAGVVSYWTKKADFQHKVNVDGTRYMLDAAANAGVKRFLFTSSIAALGYVPGDGQGDESTPFNWGGQGLAYMETKHAAQTMVLDDDRLETLAVLPGIAFGPGDLYDNGLRLLKQVASGQQKAVPGGSTTAAHLSDIVDGHLAALDRGRPGHSYILGGWTGSFLELFGLVADVVGAEPPTKVAGGAPLWAFCAFQEFKAWLAGTEPKLTRALARVSAENRQYASTRAASELGYSPRPLREGMVDAVAWAKEHGRWV